MCCFNAAEVGGIFSMVRLCIVNRIFQHSSMSSTVLVLLYISIVNRWSMLYSLSDVSCILLDNRIKICVTSSYIFQVFHAVSLPIPANADTVSHPVNEWKKGSAAHFSFDSELATQWIAINLLFFPVPNSNHNSSNPIALSFSNAYTEIT